MNRMNPRLWGVLAAAVVASLALTATAGAVTPSAVYDATPNPLPPNVASLGYEATSTSEFGDKVHLAGTNRVLDEITVTMSDWALKSDYPTVGTVHELDAPDHGQRLQHQPRAARDEDRRPSRFRGVLQPTRRVRAEPRGGPLTASVTTASPSTRRSTEQPNVTLPNDVIVGIAFNTAALRRRADRRSPGRTTR